MPVLMNPRWEQFAALCASGKTVTESYISAGYAKGNAAKSANRLAKLPPVRSRIDELCSLAEHSRAQQVWLTRNYVLDNLRQVVERAFVKHKLSDANTALRLMGLEIGMFKETHAHTVTWDGNPASLTTAQLTTLILSLSSTAFEGDPEALEQWRRDSAGLLDAPGTIEVKSEPIP